MTVTRRDPEVERPWIVQKYGGTSLGKRIEDICGEIIPTSLESNNVAVVCSALSFSSKSSGTTSLLLDCIKLAEQQNEDAAVEIHARVEMIRRSHVETLVKALRGSAVHQAGKAMEASISKDCMDVEELLKAALVCVRGSRPRCYGCSLFDRSLERSLRERRTRCWFWVRSSRPRLSVVC